MSSQESPWRARTPERPGGLERTPLELVRGAVVITALPAPVTLNLYAGDDFTMRIAVTDTEGDPVDITGALLRSHIRTSAEADNIAGEFDAVVVEESMIDMHLDSATSTALPRNCVYDLEMVQQSRVTTLIAGPITLTPEVTRD